MADEAVDVTEALRRAYDTGYRQGRAHAAGAVQLLGADAVGRVDRDAAANAARGN